MASVRKSQIQKLINVYAEKRDEQSRTSLESALKTITKESIVEVLSYGYYGGVFPKIWHYIKISFAKLFRCYDSDQRSTVFHNAVQHVHLEVIELILEIVESDEACSLLMKQTHWSQRTAAHYAAEKDLTKILQLMRNSVKSDVMWLAIISIQDQKGRTAVHASSVRSKAENIRVMLKGLKLRCTVLFMQDDEGNTALHLAAKATDSNTICEIIKDLGKPEMHDFLTIQNGELNTPIHLVAKHGNALEFLYLMSRLGEDQVEAVLDMVNYDGDTAGNIAKKRKDRSLANTIQDELRSARERDCPNSVGTDTLPSSVALPQISSRDNPERYPVTSAIVENKAEITGIKNQSSSSGNIQPEDATEPGGNIHPEDIPIENKNTQWLIK